MMKSLLGRPLLLVTLIVASSVLLNVFVTLLLGAGISAKTIILPLVISAVVSSLSVRLTSKYLEKSAALETQLELLDQVADSLGFAVDIIDHPNDMAEVLGEQVHRFLNEPLERQLTFADLLNRIHPEDRDTFLNENSNFFNTHLESDGSLSTELECRIRLANGEYRSTRVSRVVSLFKGRRTCYVQYSDIEELRQRADKLEQLAADRADNLVTVSHEIRTPLNAILGLSDLMMATRLNKIQQEYLTKIHSAADSLETLVRNMLDLRRLDSGQLNVEPEPVVTEELLESFVLLHQPVAENSSLRFLVDYSPNLPRRIEVDAQMVEQIVNNLLRNAIKFTSEGMVMLSAGFKEQSASRGDLLIEVSDTGRGIEESKIDSIFQPFQRGSAANRLEGAGLGLALVKRFCALLQGEVWLKSEVGAGTKFSIRIPVSILDADPVVDQHSLEALAKMRVLVVERRGLSASHIASVLNTQVESVSVVSDMEEALDHLDKSETDVVLIGYVFNLDDLEHFVHRLDTQLQTGLKVVAVAKLETMTSRLFSLVAGVVVDPFSLKQLVSILSDEQSPEDDSSSFGHSITAEVSSLLLLKGLRVLVAEDNEINQQVISEHLKQRGAMVTLAGDGKQAIDALTRADFDLILMDIEMPVLDGFEASERIKAEPGWKNIPIIPVSAGVTASQKERAKKVGMQGFVGKPYKIQELLDTIESVLLDRDLAPVQPELGFALDSSDTPATSEPIKFVEFDFDEASDYWPTPESLISNLQLFVEKYPVASDLFNGTSDEESGKLAHTLKGAAGFLGMARYSKRLNELSLAFKNGSATADMVSDARAAHDRVLSEVGSFLSMLE